MKGFTRRGAVLLLVLTLFIVSCKSRREYADLARAGTVYAAALDNLLTAAANIAIDADSERLLQDDALSNQSLEQYRSLSNEDEKLLIIIEQLRRHVRLMSRYFGLLQELATSDAPERAQKAIGNEKEGVLCNLLKVGDQLMGSGGLSKGTTETAAPAVGKVVDEAICMALRDELNARKQTILRELTLQERLLKTLSEKITADLAVTQETREQRRVIDPLISPKPISQPDAWISARRSILTVKLTAEQLETASEDLMKLREAFDDLTEGKLTADRANSLRTDFDALLNASEKIVD